ncbi:MULTISPECIES: sensor histidine kinase [Actinosynnema]|uniref:histidine kinase n=1 Tax=Actinosynnema pretiosum TaxID=42197 RepID=A0A290ZHV9_9PSEU|nr:sensor histidine kinase [Actinosynnema pretiosum]ATE58552.1 two-component sensor histidine kinase [Actinosynnema pretiosum]
MRAHPAFGDTLIAGVLFMFDLLTLAAAGLPRQVPAEDAGVVTSGVSGAAWLTVLVLMIGPLPVRRRYPRTTSALILLGAWVQLFTHGAVDDPGGLPLRPADMALAVALYTMVVFVGRRPSLLYLAALSVGSVLWAVTAMGGPAGVMMLFVIAPVFGFSWALGEFVGARRAYHSELEQRLRLLELERGQQARIAVGEERSRIARELHDVVAHAVSVMVVQADGAGYAIRTQPELAEAAVRTISDTGRQALAELRRLLGVLRSEDGSGAQWAPQPGAGDLRELAEALRASGLPVTLVVSGDLGVLPAGLGLGVYRIVQEALTNTLKHAGSGASAVVRVDCGPERVLVEVVDDGFGTPHDLVELSGGNGLIGMRERAGVLGGRLEAGPNPGGGWRVRVDLPLVPA